LDTEAGFMPFLRGKVVLKYSEFEQEITAAGSVRVH
jgi:hypothetical protein